MMKKFLHMAALGLALALGGCQSAQALEQVLPQLELRNPKHAIDGLLSGGQPSESDLKLLADNGVKTIINLRTKGEFDGFDEAAKVKQLGMDYQVMHISGKTGITKENAKKLDTLLNQADGGTLLHCASGNRVGALLALRAFYFQGKSADEALALGKAAGMTRLSGKVKGMLQGQK
jgi:uncharacterized protein (TIGR01244 family)